ncbi:MAG: ATP synthase subunit I [Lachnospiraceae bacterium]|nr:ATP synthase subunit I [Lachnospiraceae bacterium]
MTIIDRLKSKNRTLLEMYAGIVFWGMVCQAVGMFLVNDQGVYARSLWFGILFALVNTIHMYRSLDRALDFDEKTASKMIYRSYLFRYVSVAVVLLLVMITEVMNPLVVFLGYMGLKVTAYLQPITHKLCNKLFHETDPVPQAMPEEEQGQTLNE